MISGPNTWQKQYNTGASTGKAGVPESFIKHANLTIMAKKQMLILLAEQKILNRIFVIRGQKIMLDEDLAEMYRVETKRLNEQVKRNLSRFPKDFMFTLTGKEYENLKSQIATSSSGGQKANWGGRRKLPYAFTEQGVAMLSSILNSDVAIEVNIRIIRVFTKLRDYALTHNQVLLQLAKLEKEVKGNRKDIENIFLVLKELIEKQAKPAPPRNRIGFRNYD
jgi:ORF6N domain